MFKTTINQKTLKFIPFITDDSKLVRVPTYVGINHGSLVRAQEGERNQKRHRKRWRFVFLPLYFIDSLGQYEECFIHSAGSIRDFVKLQFFRIIQKKHILPSQNLFPYKKELEI